MLKNAKAASLSCVCVCVCVCVHTRACSHARVILRSVNRGLFSSAAVLFGMSKVIGELGQHG